MLLCVLLTATIAWAEPDYSESALLWEQAQSDYQANHFTEAYLKLKRLTEKYPTHAEYTSALLMLGQSALESEHWDSARTALRKVVMLRSHQPQGHQARIALARVDLAQKRVKNALLTTLELDREKNLDPALRMEGLILKSQALLASRQILASERALDSALATGAASPRLSALERGARLQWKLSECNRQTQASGSETEVRHRMESRGTCLLEALSLLRAVNAQPDFRELPRLRISHAQTWAQAFDLFWAACETPPAPPLKPHRTAAQLAAWRAELKDFLLTACNQTRTRALTFLEPFQPGADLELLKRSLEK